MDPATVRFTTVDPHAENYFSWSPYAYVGNNPMRLVDSDGKDWRDKLVAGAVGLVSNALPYSSSIRDLYTPNDRADYNRTLKAVDDASTVVGAALMLYGATSSSGGGGMMAAGGVVAATGVGAPEGGVVAATGAVVWGTGAATAFGGVMLMNNAQENASEGYDRGKYENVPNPRNAGEGKKTTSTQRKNLLDANRQQNNGRLKSDGDGRSLNPPSRNVKGQKADMNQAEVDHIKPRSKGGTNENSNLRIISKEENLKKSNK